jgi:dihydrodipicolinate synthase/N-acetylneuraminate lyase
MTIEGIPSNLLSAFADGMVIPAMPLALDAGRAFDERRQRALVRYYIDAGAGGIAAGVHSTQFEIRDPEVGLLEPVLSLVSETIDEWGERTGRGVLKIAGCSGKTPQAVSEARLARDLGFHACLVSLGALHDASVDRLLTHCRSVAEIIPAIGFYLQPAVGGRILSREFWRDFSALDNVLGIKIAPFNRYQTLDVVRGVCEAEKDQVVSLYTGNDDSIVVDLVTEFTTNVNGADRTVGIRGGLLGHWGFWTQKAVAQLNEIKSIREKRAPVPMEMLTLAAQITEANAAVFDPAHGFSGCISGIHEILRRQGLFSGTWCLNPKEALSPGQTEEISRIYEAYPHLNDDRFVSERLDTWLA